MPHLPINLFEKYCTAFEELKNILLKLLVQIFNTRHRNISLEKFHSGRYFWTRNFPFTANRACEKKARKAKMHVPSIGNWKHCFFFFFHLNRNYSFLFCYISIESFCNEDFVVLMVFDCAEIRSLVLKMDPSKGVQENMLTARIFTVKNSFTDALLTICRKFSEQILLGMRSDRHF